jgi:signal transduction histidine kinase
MEQTEITIFIIIANVVILIFIIGVFLFVFAYRKKRLVFEKEKLEIEKKYKLTLLNMQVQVQQQTMQFIGAEIHDSVAQKLTLASIYSQKIEYENKYPELSEKMKNISAIVNDSLWELRELSKTLTNASLQNHSLTELIKNECDKVSESGVCKVFFNSTFSEELSTIIKSSIFRVIQEFLQNSLKHSGCSEISILISQDTNGVKITAKDNGKGFDVKNNHSKGIGLNNMRRRVSQIGGNLDLQSEPDNGTVATIIIPLKTITPIIGI